MSSASDSRRFEPLLDPPPRPVPAQGETIVRVRYSECDAMGVAHHAAYIPWLEIARTELLRASGVSYASLERAGVLLVVTRLDIRYRRPVRYDDEVAIATRVAGGGRARIDHEYELRQATGDDQGGLIAAASTTIACVDRAGKPRPLPAWLAPTGHAGA